MRQAGVGRVGCFRRRDMVERDDPLSVNLAHQAGVDAILRGFGPVEMKAADKLGRIRRQHFNADIIEMERSASFG